MANAAPKRIIVDFDNTMGVEGCDVDDGLALLYLLGSPELAQVEALCTTYGNSDIETVNAATDRLLAALRTAGVSIPVHHGAASAHAETESDAARFLAQAAASEPGTLHVLATGSLTNLRHAAELDPAFFRNVASITVMGGITESLFINGKIMNELNLSCDPAATRAVIEAPCPVTIATSHHCLPAFFRIADFEEHFGRDSWLFRTCRYWFDDMDRRYAWGGFTCWDVVAAAALVHPELFEDERYPIALNDRFIGVGFLERAAEGVPCATVSTPRIADPARFCADTLATWQKAVAPIACPQNERCS